MNHPIPLVIATRNRGKLIEIADVLKNQPVRVLSLEDFSAVPQVEETGASFEENACQKASLVSRITGLPALADDSGLVVEALGGAPGIHSARYGGENLTDQQRFEKLLKEMNGRQDRNAAFECVISLAVPTGQSLTYKARCEGRIIDRPLGTGGFGYDPIFYYPPFEKTFAQIPLMEKNRISHRGKALSELGNNFPKVLAWIRQHMPSEENRRLGT